MSIFENGTKEKALYLKFNAKDKRKYKPVAKGNGLRHYQLFYMLRKFKNKQRFLPGDIIKC